MRLQRISLLLLALGTASCGDDTTAPEPEVGSVGLTVVNEPTDAIAEAWIIVEAVYLQRDAGLEDDPASREYILRDGTDAWDAVALGGEAVEVAENDAIATGTYASLQVVISEACLVTTDGASFASSDGIPFCGDQHDGPLHTSGSGRAVATIPAGIQVAEGAETRFLATFDVDGSFGRTVDGFLFVPVFEPVEPLP